MRHKYIGMTINKGDTGKGALKMVELRTFKTTHENDEFDGHPDIKGYRVDVSGLIRLHFCAGDRITPTYEEYEIAEISIDGGGYDNGAGIDMGVTSSLTPSMIEVILEDVTEKLSEEQIVLKELWGDDE